jgi:hypothetical protein
MWSALHSLNRTLELLWLRDLRRRLSGVLRLQVPRLLESLRLPVLLHVLQLLWAPGHRRGTEAAACRGSDRGVGAEVGTERHLRVAVGVSVALLGIGCQMTSEPAGGCLPTPVSELVVQGESIWGQRGGDVFFRTANRPGLPVHVLRALPNVEKIGIVLTHPLSKPPAMLDVRGRELGSGETKTFRVSHLESELGHGVQWGTNFEFPRAGCWELAVDAPENAGSVVVVVR